MAFDLTIKSHLPTPTKILLLQLNCIITGLMLDALQQIRYIPTNEIVLVLDLG